MVQLPEHSQTEHSGGLERGLGKRMVDGTAVTGAGGAGVLPEESRCPLIPQ